MLVKTLRSINRQFPEVGLPRPTSYLRKHGIMTAVEAAMENLGVRDYSTVTYPVNGGDINFIVRFSPYWQTVEEKGFEYDCLKFVSEKVGKGNRILDIGAGSGVYSLLFSKLVGATGSICAFEPDPRTRESLRDNVRRNRITNIRIDGRCISNSSGTAVLRSRQWGSGTSTIIERGCPDPSLKTVVRATTIDKYCEENRLVPDGIKIDVEGAERLVLEGARDTMRKHRPWILLEFHGNAILPWEREEIWRLLTEHAKDAVILDGGQENGPSEANLGEIPNSPYFHVFAGYQ